MITVSTPPDSTSLVEMIQRGDPAGIEALCQTFYRGIRFFVSRHLGPQEADDRAHDALLIVIQAIRRGELRDPACLPGYIRTVVQRQVAAHIDAVVRYRREQTSLHHGLAVSDGRSDTEWNAIAKQQTEIMQRVLSSMSRRDRNILIRFYLLEQSQEQICAEMNLTGTQFRLLKSRAKARFGKLGKAELRRRSVRFF